MLDYVCKKLKTKLGLPEKRKSSNYIFLLTYIMFSNKLAEIYQDPYKNTN